MMKKLKHCLLLASFGLLMTSKSWAQVTDLPSLQAQLQQFPIVRGDFTQSRKIEMFEQPLTFV